MSGGGDGPAPSLDALVPVEMARRAESVGQTKATMPLRRLIPLSILAGAFISLGAMFSTVVTAGGGMAPGVSRLLGGLSFSLGLVLVVVGGAELFTGNTLIVMAAASRRVRVGTVIRHWIVVYLGNFAGAVATALLVFWSGQYRSGGGAVGVRAMDIAAAKTSLGTVEAIALGVLANALVCLAVWLSFSARSLTDKVFAVVFPVTAFVAAGFEHSIANMYFIPEAIFIRAWGADRFWDAAHTTSDRYSGVDLRGFLLGNLLPVTVGNLVGGGLLVGLVYWFVYLRER